jgi:hypothetical protein
MKKNLRYVMLMLLLLGGCESSFDPRGPFLDRLVVYGVLTPMNQEHYVRLFSTYDPPGLNPLNNTSSNQITNAIVSIAFDTTTVALRDTVVPRNDPGRYTDSIRAFVASLLPIARGRTYALTVNSAAYGVLTASTRIPGTGQIEIDTESRFSLTAPAVASSDISIFVIPSQSTEGHAVRIFVEYELPVANPGVIVTEEVPLDITNYRNCMTFDSEYPIVRRRELVGGRELWRFRLENYRRALIRILKVHEGSVVDFKRVFIELVQTDEHLYKYYSIVNGFQDRFSIRVDQPNYTNIAGGLGLFGSFVSDTTVISGTLSPSFPDLICPDP